MNDSLIQVGGLVRVRQRSWIVEDVRIAPDASPVVRLACTDDDAPGLHLDVVWDAEIDARAVPADRPAITPGAVPDDPKVFAAYLHALRWACVTSTDPTLFQAPLRAGIVPKAYQLEPLRKALALPRVNLFIADDTGAGKTIEAGLVLQELLLRQRVQRVVVACPASVVLQWRDELEQRFGLSFAVLDKAYVNARRRERGFGVNPWRTDRFFVISHALLRDEDYLVGLRDWLGAFAPSTLLILDEAHAAAPASQSRYAIDSQFTRAVRDVARRFEHRLFLSATPHNGHSNSFASLLEILDPQRFTRGVPVKNAAALKPVMVRRLKQDLRKHVGSQIPARKTIQIDLADLPSDTPELVLSTLLAEYADLLERRLAGGGSRARAAGALVSIALQKRLLSSIDAFARTLSVHRRTAEKALATGPHNGTPTTPALFDTDDEDLAEEQTREIDDVEVERATRAGANASDDARARELLSEMSSLAERTRDLPDAKVTALLTWVHTHQCPELVTDGKPRSKSRWRPRRVLIFTEYSDSKNYLVAQLEAAIAGTDHADDRVLTLHGGMPDDERERVKAAFNDPNHPVRILVATDAAREGVNLQAQCADLFHFDLPWNPARMEQRNGRIDRTLQPEPEVRCHYFIYPQRPEDAVLAALVEKSRRIHEELGSLADVIDQRLATLLAGGFTRGNAAQLATAVRGADLQSSDARQRAVIDELEGARDREISDQLDVLDKLYQKARDHLDFKPERLHDVVNLGLHLAGFPGLTARTAPPHSFDVPPLDKLAGSDATWREIIDTLRAPRSRKLPEWAWRAEYPPRPVSFEPATTLAAETVQLHLQHKLTQRALAQFRTQAFGEDRLSRVTVVADPTHSRKRVLALARLSVYGAGASRLHEEILVVAAYWMEGDDPARLKPFETADAEARALDSLTSVLARDAHAVAPHVVSMLTASAPRDEEALWSTVQHRARARVLWAEEKLRRRGEGEAEEMLRILRAQQTAIEKELERRRAEAEREAGADQLTLPWLPEEKDQRAQYEADAKHIEARRVALDAEIVSEPERVRRLYDVRHQRLERVGLVYLWPTTG